jgi:hypothetical protein
MCNTRNVMAAACACAADNQGATNPIYPDWWLAEPDAQQATDQQQQQSWLGYPLPKQYQQLVRLSFKAAKLQAQCSGTRQQLPSSATYVVVSMSNLAQSCCSAPHPLSCAAPCCAVDLQADVTTCMPATQQQLQQQLLQGALEPEPTLLLKQFAADNSTSQPQQQLQQQQGELVWGQLGPAGPSAAAACRGSRTKNAAAAAAVQGRGPAAVLGRGLPNLKHVESKIKQSVAASRQKAAAKQQRQQQLLSSVVATSSSHSPGQQQQQQQQVRAAAAPLEEACPPAATADQFISNPWTSWFVPGAPADLSVPAAAATAAAVMAGGAGSISSGEACSEAPSEAAAAAAAGGRGALQDITGGLNQQQGSSWARAAALAEPLPGEPWGLAAGSCSFALGSAAQKHAGSRQPELQEAAAQSQPPPQQQRRAWAADFGHLDAPQLDAAAQQQQQQQQQAALGAAGRRRAGPHQQRQQWRQRWVGNYGHLEG